MPTRDEIQRQVLYRLKANAQQSVEASKTEEGRLLNSIYDTIREEVLTETYWQFSLSWLKFTKNDVYNESERPLIAKRVSVTRREIPVDATVTPNIPVQPAVTKSFLVDGDNFLVNSDGYFVNFLNQYVLVRAAAVPDDPLLPAVAPVTAFPDPEFTPSAHLAELIGTVSNTPYRSAKFPNLVASPNAQSVELPNGFEYAYNLPSLSTFIRPYEFYPDVNYRILGRHILVSFNQETFAEDELQMIYQYLPREELFPKWFVALLVSRLCAAAAFNLKASTERQQLYAKEYEDLLMKSRAKNAAMRDQKNWFNKRKPLTQFFRLGNIDGYGECVVDTGKFPIAGVDTRPPTDIYGPAGFGPLPKNLNSDS